jgi:hypothetical protein
MLLTPFGLKKACQSVEQEENEKITKRAYAGRGHEPKWEIPVNSPAWIRKR